MTVPRRTEREETLWKQCLECGSRYRAGKHGYRVNWCSPACEHASMRRQRNSIENGWLRSVWFLR
ncbi:MAG TPA: hypothetical protein VG872_00055 [Acidimicrobiia bacterium]|nr:hypothetical protein [Acidimicrobiia bacterium]